LPPALGSSGPAGQRVLGRQHDALAAAFQQLAKLLLRLAVGVVARGVDEVATPLEEEIEHPARLRQLRAPAPSLAERHRPKGDLTHAKRRTSEQPVSQLALTSSRNRTATKVAISLRIRSH